MPQLFCGTGWSEPVPGLEFHPLKSSAFHGALFRQLGLSPADWRANGRGRVVRFNSNHCRLVSEIVKSIAVFEARRAYNNNPQAGRDLR
jgi:hypothetical protein